MKKFLIFVVVLAIVGFQGYKILDRRAFEENSRKRVEGMFENLKSGNLADEQDAIGYWRVGHPEAASQDSVNSFARFRSAGNFGAVQSFGIVSTETGAASDSYARYIDLTCQVNGKTLRIRARHHQPLEWVN